MKHPRSLGADVYSVDIDSTYLMRRSKLSEAEVTPDAACRKSDVIITGLFLSHMVFCVTASDLSPKKNN